MTSIKPPGGKPPSGPADAASHPSGSTHGAERAGPTFGETLREAADAARTERAGPSQPPAALEPVAALAEAVKAGELSADQAIDQLLERTVGELAPRLTGAERAELLSTLRSALETDPALAAIVQQLKS
jgi:hypothetical protein